MKFISFIVFIGFLFLSFFSCRKDLDYDPATQAFRFSRDTLFLDTVFSQIRSETYAFKIYNTENKDVVIPRLFLEQGNNSYYKINVDGLSGTSFNNVAIRAKDSLFVFVEIAPALNPPNSVIVEEDFKIESDFHSQTVKLISLVEDAEFFYPQNGQTNTSITQNTVWDNTKSKIVFGKLLVDNGASLTIEEGTKLYFHKNSSLEIKGNSQLNINGTLQNPVIIRGDRHDTRYDTLPANWDKIYLHPTALANIQYAKITGGIIGLDIDNATANIFNTQIFNQVSAGISANNSTIQGQNLLINNCGDADLAIFNGGNYSFTHCTFANYWDLNFGNAYSIYLSNFIEDENGNYQTHDLNSFQLYNSILYNNGQNSFVFQQDINSAFNYNWNTNLFKLSTTNGYNPANDPFNTNFIINENPLFTDVRLSVNNLSPKPTSIAYGTGNVNFAQTVPLDFFGNNRTGNPTLGAIQ